jgi:hypothetical protein
MSPFLASAFHVNVQSSESLKVQPKKKMPHKPKPTFASSENFSANEFRGPLICQCQKLFAKFSFSAELNISKGIEVNALKI